MTRSDDIRGRSAPGPDPGGPIDDPWRSVEWPPGWTVSHVAETGSTNDDLLAQVASGDAADRTALTTDHQTAGRGRLDRRWDAPPGANLLVSIVIAPVPSPPIVATQVVAVAATDALDALAGRRLPTLGLKWPNDLVVDDRKLAGVLAQRAGGVDAVVVGLGLNVGWAPAGAATVAGDLALDVHPVEVLRRLLVALDRRRAGRIADAYRGRLTTLGRRVRVERVADELVGTAIDVDDLGRLVVATADGGDQAVDVGDVVHLRAADR